MLNMDNSNIDFDALAFKLFRRWTENVQKEYPEKDFTIIDERILVKNLKDSIKSGLIDTLTYKDKSPGWYIGFMQGFIESNLNVHWYFEYITKQTENYKQYLALNATISCLVNNSGMLKESSELYKQTLTKDINLKNIDFNVEERKYVDKQLDIEIGSFNNQEVDCIIKCLSNLSIDLITQILSEETETFLTDISDIVSEDICEKLLSSIKY